MVRDVDEAQFDQLVVERSHEVPVVVDFWAEWCGPCRALGPLLEKAAGEREGKVELAKVDTDKNPGISQAFGIRGIPAVKAFKDGEVVSEFTGAIPGPQVERFFDQLVPPEADPVLEEAREMLRRGDNDQAIAALEPYEFDFAGSGLLARAQLQKEGRLAPIFEAWDRADYEGTLEQLQEALADAGSEDRDLIRRIMVSIFEELGPQSELAGQHRRRLASRLN
jgi:putative thioredoxin